jgi:transposase
MSTEEKGRRRQTATLERVQIIEKHAAGESIRQIAKELNISKSGAQKIIHDWKKDGKIHIAPRTGGPRKLTESDERYLLLSLNAILMLLYTKLPHFPT